MRPFPLLLLFFSAPLASLMGQISLSGIVIDSSDQAPIPFATVYFDGTTNGQTTDDKGYFSLALNGVELPAVLVVSHVGYRTQTLNVTSTEARITIQLGVQGQLIETVVVQDRDQRMKNIKEFRSVYLGVDEWGKRATINNEEALLFAREYTTHKLKTTSKHMRRITVSAKHRGGTWAADSSYYTFEKATNLQAKGKVPLEIQLPDLGYILQVDLVGFVSEYKAGRTAHLGHYFFRPAEKNGKPKARHQRNREQAYYNSSLHFLRSLYANQLEENGYQIYLQEKAGFGKPKKLKAFDLTPYVHLVEDDQVEIRGLKGKHLAILYYGDSKGRPLAVKKRKRKQPIQSGIYIGEDVCQVRADGTVGESDLAFSGYIGTRGVAWILPSDYQPED